MESWFLCSYGSRHDRVAHTENTFTTTIGDATEELKKRGLDWKEDEMELISWVFAKMWETYMLKLEEQIRDQRGGRSESHGALITKEADSMSAGDFG